MHIGHNGKEPVWEVPRSFFLLQSSQFNFFQPIAELLTGPRAVAANVVYLRDQEYKFRARPGGREWSVCGSPVNTSHFILRPLDRFITFFFSLVPISVAVSALLVTTRPTLEVRFSSGSDNFFFLTQTDRLSHRLSLPADRHSVSTTHDPSLAIHTTDDI